MSEPLVTPVNGIPVVGGSFTTAGFPPRPQQPLPPKDARTLALDIFADFLATLEFRRYGGDKHPPIPFKVARKNIHIEQPDHVEDMKFPAIAFIPGRGTFESFGLGPPNLKDDTVNKFAPGTALLESAEYKERFIIEVWGSKKGERRAMMAGLETALLRQESSYSIRFLLRDYFDTTAEFSLEERENIDDPDVVRNRRRGHFFADLSVCIVQLVNIETLTPVIVTEVEDPSAVC